MSFIHLPPSWRIAERDATPEDVFLDRRQVVRGLGLGVLGLAGGTAFAETAATAAEVDVRPALGGRFSDRFPAPRHAAFSVGGRALTPEEKAGGHNNFYEFTLVKERVWELARGYAVEPWKVEVTGLVKKARTLDLDGLFAVAPLEERLYRFRCVERWAMQVPWTGYPLRALIDALEPLPSARYVRFTSVLDPDGLPGQKNSSYDWPYYEGLRLDEARHELAFVVLGSYGHALPMQHGAPWRLALPWKYGYKGPKSLVRIEFLKQKPRTFWNDAQPSEYGFFSNVEPHKPHPRWPQTHETDIGTGETRETLLYNGYRDEVGGLYDGREI